MIDLSGIYASVEVELGSALEFESGLSAAAGVDVDVDVGGMNVSDGSAPGPSRRATIVTRTTRDQGLG